MSTTIVSGTMQHIVKEINQNPDPIQGMDLLYHFEIEGEIYKLQLKDGHAAILENDTSTPQCTLIMSSDHFNKFLAGKLNGMTAFMTGKLKIQGDMTKALKLENIVKQYELDI